MIRNLKMRMRVENEQAELTASREHWQQLQRQCEGGRTEKREEIEFHQRRLVAMAAQHRVELDQARLEQVIE